VSKPTTAPRKRTAAKARPRKRAIVAQPEQPTVTRLASPPPEGLTIVQARVAQLREMAETDPQRAQDEMWKWFLRLGKARDAESFDEMFRLGNGSISIEGPTEGILMMWVNPVMHRLSRPILGNGRALQPWRGKFFHSDTLTGVKRFEPWFPPLARIPWPFYRGHRKGEDGEDLMFDMDNGTIADPLDPRHTIWKIDYREVRGTPWFVRHCLDTLVEMTPDTYLGRLYYDNGGDYTLLLYFALKQPAA